MAYLTADEYMKHWIARRVWKHLNWPKHQKRFEIIASLLEGEKFIDVGCAFGHSTAHLKKFRPGDWTGLDFSEQAIRTAKEIFKKKDASIKFIFAPTFEDMDHDKIYDSVVCSEVIEHVEDDESLIRNLIPLARRRIILTTPCIRVSDPGHVRLYDLETIGKLFSMFCDFWTITVKKIDPFFYIIMDWKEGK